MVNQQVSTKHSAHLSHSSGTLAALAVVVSLLHWFVLTSWMTSRMGWGSHANEPARMQVAFVRELRPQAAPKVLTRAAPVVTSPGPRALRPSEPAASAPEQQLETSAANTPVPEAPARAQALAEAASAPVSAAETPVSEPAHAVAAVQAPASAPAQDVVASAATDANESTTPQAPAEQLAANPWPPSTRLDYRLTGHYHGPVEGQARVEWLMQEMRYQVFMDLSIGPSFAPLASRRVASEGLVTAQGLAPRRYTEVTRALGSQRRLVVDLGEQRITLSQGRVEARPAGVQDSASQFVHLTWLFTTQPGLLAPGQSVTLPLALPRTLEPWTYDVLAAQTLHTPAGPVETFHVKPRRPPRPGVDLTAELWVAPSLQYLPVRIMIRQDAETYLDLLIERLPQQAEQRR